MWLGEQITERGIGNGISLIIFAGIVVGLPRAIFGLFDQIRTGNLSILTLLFVLAFMVRDRRDDRLRRAGAAAHPRPVREARRRAGGFTAARTRTCRCGSTPAASSRSSSRSRSSRSRTTSRNFIGADWMKRVASLALAGPAALRHPVRASGSSSSATSTRRSSSTRPTRPTTCASTAGSSRASGPAARRPTTSTPCCRA